VVLSEGIVSFGSLPVYENLEIVTVKIILSSGKIWSFSTVSVVSRRPTANIERPFSRNSDY